MKRLAILVPQHALEMSVGLLRDICWMSTVAALNEQHCDDPPGAWLQVLSADGMPVISYTGSHISVDGSFADLQPPDALFLATFGDSPERALRDNRQLIEELPRLHALGCPMVGISTSVYFLAEAGLLDGKVATVYPEYADDFAQRYPRVNLRPGRIVTHTDNLFCANGIPSTMDLHLAIIEQLYGPRVVRKIDHQVLLGFQRNYEQWHLHFDQYKYHSDAQILTAQQHLERHYNQPTALQDLAGDIGMSPRNFTRRFKLATDLTPQAYLHSIRIGVARELLKTTDMRSSEVAFQVGYADVSSFNKQFKRSTGLSPKDFRN